MIGVSFTDIQQFCLRKGYIFTPYGLQIDLQHMHALLVLTMYYLIFNPTVVAKIKEAMVCKSPGKTC